MTDSVWKEASQLPLPLWGRAGVGANGRKNRSIPLGEAGAANRAALTLTLSQRERGFATQAAIVGRETVRGVARFTAVLLLAALFLPIASAQDQQDNPRPDQDETAGESKQDAKNTPAARRVNISTIRRKLQARTDLKVDKTPLKEVIDQLAKRHAVPIRLDESSLKKAGIDSDAPVTASIKNLTLNETLRQVLKGLHLQHDLRDGAIIISADADAEADLAQAGKAHAERMEEKRLRAEEQARAIADVERANQGRAAAVPVEPNQAEDDALQKQFVRRFNTCLGAELDFLEKVCEPTDEQLGEIRQVLEKYRADLVKQQLINHKRVARGQIQGMPAYADPRRLIRDSLKRTLKSTLDSGRWARFERELAERTSDQTRAAVHNVVAKIDGDLTLSADQREKLVEVLSASWNAPWGQQFEIFLQQGGLFAPNLPPKLVTPHLNAIQKKIWSAMQANQQNQQVLIQQGMFLNPGGRGAAVGLMGIALDELDDDDDEEGDDTDETRDPPTATDRQK